MSLLLRVTLLLFALSLRSPCEGLSGGYGSWEYGNKPSKSPATAPGAAGVLGQPAPRRGLGVSAWGIVVIIMAVILGGMGFYYFSMCYPILCKKQRKYDAMHIDTA